MIDDMRMRQLSPKTQDIYLRIVREFARFRGRPPDTATVEDLRRYQLHHVNHGTSLVSLNHAITGLKFFFRGYARPARPNSQDAPGARAPHPLLENDDGLLLRKNFPDRTPGAEPEVFPIRVQPVYGGD